MVPLRFYNLIHTHIITYTHYSKIAHLLMTCPTSPAWKERLRTGVHLSGKSNKRATERATESPLRGKSDLPGGHLSVCEGPAPPSVRRGAADAATSPEAPRSYAQVSLPRLSLLRFFDSKLPGNSLSGHETSTP